MGNSIYLASPFTLLAPSLSAFYSPPPKVSKQHITHSVPYQEHAATVVFHSSEEVVQKDLSMWLPAVEQFQVGRDPQGLSTIPGTTQDHPKIGPYD